MSQKYKIISGFWFNSSLNSFWIKIGAGAWVEKAFPSSPGPDPGWQYAVGDGSITDFVALFDNDLQLAVDAYPGTTSSSNTTVSMTTSGGLATGLIKIDWTDGDGLGALQISFCDPADPYAGNNTFSFHNILQMTSTPTSTISISGGGSGSKTSNNVSGGSFYPRNYLMSDISEYINNVMQAIPDSGAPQTIRTSMRTKHTIGIRLDRAYPRSVIYNEYAQLKGFMEQASKGVYFRLYPDVTNSTIYSAANPFGYSTYVLDKESMSWRPEPVSGNWYGIMDVDLQAWLI